MSLSTPSWVRARSHCPPTMRSWNSMILRFAFAGSPRTEPCPCASRSTNLVEPLASSPSFSVALTRPSSLPARDQQVAQLAGVVLLLLLAGLAHRQDRPFDVLAGRARLEGPRRRLV